MLLAPLEQFQILLLIEGKIFYLYFPITNFLIINILSVLTFLSIIFFCGAYSNKSNNFFYLVSNFYQRFLEILTEVCIQLVANSITKDNEKYLIFISTIFILILFSNLIGLIPYTFTITSHVHVTFCLSFSIFIGVNIITIRKYGFKSFLLFFPPNTSIYLALILVPIEFISYIAKPISLGVRLFINLMAGHTLLKVIVGFSWDLLSLESNSFTVTSSLIPLITLIILFGLELGVALIQTYVFIILTCIYLQDGS